MDTPNVCVCDNILGQKVVREQRRIHRGGETIPCGWQYTMFVVGVQGSHVPRVLVMLDQFFRVLSAHRLRMSRRHHTSPRYMCVTAQHLLLLTYLYFAKSIQPLSLFYTSVPYLISLDCGLVAIGS